MVTGFTKFKEKFQGFEDQYVVIGGTACDLLMENEDMTFRATKDIDIVLIVEAITAEFGKAFWEYIKEAEYEHKNKSTGNTQFYRFTSPKSKEYPFMIEIFSKKPEFISLDENAVLTPLPIDDEISSLSAILLNDAYYDLLKDGQIIVDGIPVLREVCLILFKAKAWLDLTERKANGEMVDSKNIKKHKNDVFRLGQLITAESRQVLAEEIVTDMKRFLDEMEKETVDLKALGIRGFNQKSIMRQDLRECGKRIQQLRKERGLTQEQLAEKLNVSQNTIAKIESGLRRPSIPMMQTEILPIFLQRKAFISPGEWKGERNLYL